MAVKVRLGRPVMVWRGEAVEDGLVMAVRGRAGFSKAVVVWLGLARQGEARFVKAVTVSQGAVREAGHGLARHGSRG